MIDTTVENEPWPTSTVGAHFDVQLGKMLDAARNAGDPKPYLGNRAVQWGRIDRSAVSEVPLTREEKSRYRLKRNDLLVCEGGEVGRAAIWRDELPECYYQKALHRLRPKAGFDPRVMLALLEYWAETNAFDDFVTQTSIAHLPRERFLTMPLSVIRPAEQKRIAEVLDDADRLIAVLERLIVKREAIKEGMMQELLTGKSRLPGFTGQWSLKRVPALLTRINTQPFKLTTSQYGITGRIPIVDQGQQLVVGFTDDDARALPVGDQGVIVFGDHTCIVKFVDFDFAVGADGTQVLQAQSGNSTMFLAYALQLRQIPSTGYNRHYSLLKELEFEVPHKEEQEKIASVIDDVANEVVSLKSQLSKWRAIKQGMMQELLTGRTRLPVAEEAIVA